jgi:hypothetical protein
MLLLAATAACGTASATGVSGREIKPFGTPVLSGTVNGLLVAVEDVSPTTRQFSRSYADRISVYSLRGDGGVLQATLQVSRFRQPARLRNSSFRSGLVEQLSTGTRAQVVRVARTDVNVTRATGQRLFVWFGRDRVFVFSVRDGYRARYALLRAVLTAVKT